MHQLNKFDKILIKIKKKMQNLVIKVNGTHVIFKISKESIYYILTLQNKVSSNNIDIVISRITGFAPEPATDDR